MNTLTFLEMSWHDVRYACRTLRQHPMFTAVCLLTLAIGIGANTAVFSVLNSVLLKPLPYPHADKLVALRQVAPGAEGLADLSDGLLLSPSMYVTYDQHNRSFEAIGVWAADRASVTRIGSPEEVGVIGVTDGVLQTLAVSPALGRWLTARDQIPDGPRNIMLGYGYWQRRFGGAISIIGKTIWVNSRSWQIIGVMPRGFQIVDQDFDLLMPLAFPRTNLKLAGFGFNGIARLKAGVTIPRADADIARLLPVWMDSWTNGPGTNPHFYENWRIRPAIRPLKQAVIGSIGNVLWVVMGTIGLVMLMACANVTNLMLVRIEARQQELAVREALGASSRRILRIILVESGLLGFAGGLVASALAYIALRVLVAIGPGQLPRLNEITLDTRTYVLTLLLSVLVSLFIGLISAFKHLRPQNAGALRSGNRTSTASRERHRTRNILVAAQVALALVLLVSAGLMIRTVQALHSVDPVFSDGRHLQTVRITIPTSLVPNPERVARMQNDLADKLASIPGVSSAAFASQMPMENFGSDWDEIRAENQPRQQNGILPLRLYKYASPGFFHTAGTRLLAGRDITWEDIYKQRHVVLVSENLARELWSTPSAAIGKRVREFSEMPWHEVIGVVQNTRENGVAQDAPETIYWPPLMQYMFGSKALEAKRDVTFIVRTRRAGTARFLDEVRRAVWSVEPDLPIASTPTMEEIYHHSLARPSFTLVMLAIAGAMAFILGVVGVYGVISYAVSQRRREIGIRLAFGARKGELHRMFVWSAVRISGLGVLCGLAMALGLTRFMKSLVFEVSPLDPMTFFAVLSLLTVAVIVASYVPARRAATFNPIEVLNAE
jgi:predicted permease